MELVFAVSRGEVIEKFCAKDHAESPDVKQEVGTGGNPSLAIGAQGAARNETVQMEVVAQGLIPRMKDRQESDPAVEVGAAKIGERFGDRLEEDGDQDLGIDEEQEVEFVRDREDQMEVSGRKKFLFVAREPAVRC